jgi:uncharacterized protein (TIGR03032 family)
VARGNGTTEATEPGAAAAPRLELLPSRQFASWLAERGASLAFTTYQAGKLFLIGVQPNGRLSVFERTFSRCMGLAATGQTLWMSSLYQLWRFENALGAEESHKGHDRLYVPIHGYTTGDLDIHDIGLDGDGRPLFVNTLFFCLATTSETHSFKPVWRPAFVSRLAAGDRCHLNGLAMAVGEPSYVTAVAETDVADGWREQRRDGGIVIEVAANRVVARGLSMPHSPRLHQGALWLLNSGTGHLGWCDLKEGRFEPVAFCPGYLRGLAVLDRFAVLGLSRSRENRTFGGLELDDNLKWHKVEPRCAMVVVDLKSGDVVHWLEIRGAVQELYDVAVLPGVRRPMALGFKTDEIRRVLTIEDAASAESRS